VSQLRTEFDTVDTRGAAPVTKYRLLEEWWEVNGEEELELERQRTALREAQRRHAHELMDIEERLELESRINRLQRVLRLSQ